MNLGHSLCIEHIENHVGCFLQLAVILSGLYFFYQNNILFIYCSNKVLGLGCKQTAHRLQCIHILFMLGFNQEYHALYVGFDMKLFRTVVNVHQKQVVQQQVLDEIVLVKPLLVCYQKILNLESCQLSYHIHIVTAALGQQNILQLMLVKYLKKLISRNHLAVRRRIHKR